MKIKLGDKVRDKVSGYEGIATSRTEYLNGCFQIEITPRIKKGVIPKETEVQGLSLDEQQLEKIGNGINTPKKEVVKTETGGAMRIILFKKR